MNVIVNGESCDLPEGATIATLLDQLEVRLPQVAVERNLEVVPRAEHSQTLLAEGDRLEVVTLVGGG